MSEETNVIELEPELEDLASKLDGLTLLQASKLVKHLEDKWGVSAAAPVAVAAAPAGGDGGGETQLATGTYVSIWRRGPDGWRCPLDVGIPDDATSED